jgi:hypothetical protein
MRAIDTRGHVSATMPAGLTLAPSTQRLHALVVLAHGWRMPSRLPCAWKPLDQRPPVYQANGVRYVVIEHGTVPRLKLVVP